MTETAQQTTDLDYNQLLHSIRQKVDELNDEYYSQIQNQGLYFFMESNKKGPTYFGVYNQTRGKHVASWVFESPEEIQRCYSEMLRLIEDWKNEFRTK